jgi:hypothetical protein
LGLKFNPTQTRFQKFIFRGKKNQNLLRELVLELDIFSDTLTSQSSDKPPFDMMLTSPNGEILRIELHLVNNQRNKQAEIVRQVDILLKQGIIERSTLLQPSFTGTKTRRKVSDAC